MTVFVTGTVATGPLSMRGGVAASEEPRLQSHLGSSLRDFPLLVSWVHSFLNVQWLLCSQHWVSLWAE
jgi:hypothetical protein